MLLFYFGSNVHRNSQSFSLFLLSPSIVPNSSHDSCPFSIQNYSKKQWKRSRRYHKVALSHPTRTTGSTQRIPSSFSSTPHQKVGFSAKEMGESEIMQLSYTLHTNIVFWSLIRSFLFSSVSEVDLNYRKIFDIFRWYIDGFMRWPAMVVRCPSIYYGWLV